LHKDITLDPIISIENLTKVYASGHEALKPINLAIASGEIFALLGPNGAGKTTLISIICGIVKPSSGTVKVAGFDIQQEYRKTRALIGLVPQELSTDAFESVWATVSFSRGLFGLPANPAHIEKILKQLSLWDKRNSRMMQLSGGMKRRVLIAKALAHEPKVLFLDEPTAGVDVSLRRDMWEMVRGLKQNGVTIILTTHYIEEAEEMADRVGVINNGQLMLVEQTRDLMEKMGKKELRLQLQMPLAAIPDSLSKWELELMEEGAVLLYRFDIQQENTGIAQLLRELDQLGIDFKDLHSDESSLEEIFVNLVKESA